MTDNPENKEPMIPFLSLGDMRMVGLKVPSHLAQEPDEAVMVLPRSAALDLAGRILKRWAIEDAEAGDFLESIPDDVLRDVLVIHQMLLILFKNIEPAKWVQGPNKSVEDRTPWTAIIEGESERVRRYLEHHVFNGGW